MGFTFFFSVKVGICWVEINRLPRYDCHIILILYATLVHADIGLSGGRGRLWILLQQPISDELHHHITLSLLIALVVLLGRLILLCFVRIHGMLVSL